MRFYLFTRFIYLLTSLSPYMCGYEIWYKNHCVYLHEMVNGKFYLLGSTYTITHSRVRWILAVLLFHLVGGHSTLLLHHE